MLKILFTLGNSEDLYDPAPKLDCFYKCLGRYGFTENVNSAPDDLHPLNLSDDYVEDANALKKIFIRSRFTNTSGPLYGVFCLNLDDDLFDGMDADSLQDLISSKYEQKELEEFLNSARI